MEDARYNPLEKEVQRQILSAAIERALDPEKGGHKPGTMGFVDDLGKALFDILNERCKEPTPYAAG